MDEIQKNYNIELEQCILGFIILNHELVIEKGWIAKIKEYFFHETLHQKIFREIVERVKNEYSLDSKIINFNEIFIEIEEAKNYLSVLLKMGFGFVDFKEAVKELQELYALREIEKLTHNSNLRGDELRIKIEEIKEKITREETDTIESVSQTVAERLLEIENNKDVDNFIKTNFLDFDRSFGGLPKGQVSLLAGSPSMGKAQPLDSNVLTNFGWKKMRDVKLGDKIIDPFGKQVEVIGIFPQGIRPCYKIKFIDREVIADENHLWEVFLNTKWKEPRILTTKQLSEMVVKTHYKNKLSIRYFNGEYGIKKDFLISPYTLGVLLGDGCLYKSCQWCKTDQDIVQRVSRELNEDYEVRSSLKEKGNMNRIVRKKRNNTNIYIEELKRLNLLGTVSDTKFIPQEYMHTCRQQRLDLLNGLLDTDGSIVNKNGTVEYSTASEVLAKQVQQLVFSLGLRCSLKKGKSFLYGVRKKDRYRLKISGIYYNELFYTQRKKSKLKLDRKIKERLTISYVEPIEPQETQCILVDSPEHLYITDNYISTHNTSCALQIAINVARQGKNVLFFSQEMGKNEINNKIISNLYKIDGFRITCNNLYPSEIEMIKDGKLINEISTLNIDYSTSIDADIINRKIIEYKLKFKKDVDLVIIDHLHIMKDFKKSNNRNEELGNITKDVKNIAKNKNIAILLLSQLSRKDKTQIKGHKNYRPDLIDIRESGNIEANCDLIIFIHRPEYYVERDMQGLEGEELRYSQELLKQLKGQTYLLIKKNRNGICKDIQIFFEGNYSLFRDVNHP